MPNRNKARKVEDIRCHECTGMLPVTSEVVDYLREQGFKGFDPNTHMVAMPHFLPDLIDWISALKELGMKPENIHLLAKQYSVVSSTRDQLVQMGVDVIDYTPAAPGKYYETLIERDLPKFWRHCKAKINASLKGGPQTVLVMDDGGRVLKSVPDELRLNPNVKMVGVEQTTNGFDVAREEGHSIDIVVPAMSALKLEFEPPFIAEAAMRKLRDKLGMFYNRDVAVVGIGKIGGFLAEMLANNHNKVFVFDKEVSIKDGQLHDPKHLVPDHVNVYEAPLPGEPRESARLVRGANPPSGDNYYVCNSLEQAVQSSNYVFGCSGRDVFKGIDLDKFTFQGPHKKVDETRFISLSSGDKEFKSLLTWMADHRTALHHGPAPKGGSRWDVTANIGGSRLRVMQQGFPINFDGITGSGTPEEMQLISSFLLGSVVQGYEYLKKYPLKSADDNKDLIMLSPAVQRRILLSWFDKVPSIQGLFKPERVEQIRSDPQWFAQHSFGSFYPVFKDDYPTPECLAQKAGPATPPNEKEIRHGQTQ